MTTIRQLVTDGYREGGILAVGVSPSGEEHEEGLRHLHRILRSLFGNEIGEPLRSYNYGSEGLLGSGGGEDISGGIAANFIPSNIRLVCNNSEEETLYLDPSPDDGARIGIIDRAGNFSSNSIELDGNGRSIESLSSIVLSQDGVNREWFYRADLGGWLRVTDPGADEESPLPPEFDDLLTTLLAFRINPRYGAETSANLDMTMTMMRKRFRSRYRQGIEMPVEAGLLALTSGGLYVYDFNGG